MLLDIKVLVANRIFVLNVDGAYNPLAYHLRLPKIYTLLHDRQLLFED